MIELPTELQAVAIEELNEVPSRIPEYLQNLRDWIGQQPHLRVRDDDKFLIQFLRGCKYSLENAKERLDNYYTLRTKYPELFMVSDINSPEVKKILDLGFLAFLPKPLHDCGSRIALFRCNYTIPEYNIKDIFRCAAAKLDWALYTDPYIGVNGITVIVDMSLLSMNHIMAATPGVMKKHFAYFTKLPLRIKGFYIINTSPLAVQMYKLLLPFFPEKIKQRTILCGNDIKGLLDLVPQSYLPKEYGGENCSLDEVVKDWHKTLRENASFFEENSTYGVDETLRPGKPINFDSIYGMDGSFKKLEVD